MFSWLIRDRSLKPSADQLYGASVAAARDPALFRGLGVADTIEGRFEILIVHLFVVLDRLRAEGEAGAELARALVERFFEALDDTMREMGVGDVTVPKKMHKAAGAFYGRLDAYATAIRAASPEPLADALRRNVYGRDRADGPADGQADDRADALACHVRAMAATLATQPLDGLSRGVVVFPPVEGIVHG
ncbi:MAG: ubiquinol-cytochrome C chaperone family protein [Hyphomicrobiaceae bacterium]